MRSKVMFDTSKVVRTYPYLGYAENNGAVVLFTQPKTGTQVNNIRNNMGLHSEDWLEINFEYFNGEVTLNN
jgi:hypothetical protein